MNGHCAQIQQNRVVSNAADDWGIEAAEGRKQFGGPEGNVA